MQLRCEVDQIVLADALAINRWRFAWEGLCQRGLLAWNVGLWNGFLLDRPHGCAGHAIEDIQETSLVGSKDRLDPFTVDCDITEYRRRRRVVIPEIVMHHLKVPHQLTVLRIEDDEGIGKEILAMPVAAIVRDRWSTQRDIHVAEFLVTGEGRPRRHIADELSRALFPSLGPAFSLLRQHVERP